MSSEIATPYDAEIVRFQKMPREDFLYYCIAKTNPLPELLFKREGYLLGYEAHGATKGCGDPDCACLQDGKQAEAEEPSVLGRQT